MHAYVCICECDVSIYQNFTYLYYYFLYLKPALFKFQRFRKSDFLTFLSKKIPCLFHDLIQINNLINIFKCWTHVIWITLNTCYNPVSYNFTTFYVHVEFVLTLYNKNMISVYFILYFKRELFMLSYIYIFFLINMLS